MREAIALARQHRPDLTLMDVQLKGGDSGIETAKYLREHSQAAVVFLTAFSDQARLRQAQAVAAFGQGCPQARLALTTGYWGKAPTPGRPSSGLRPPAPSLLPWAT